MTAKLNSTLRGAAVVALTAFVATRAHSQSSTVLPNIGATQRAVSSDGWRGVVPTPEEQEKHRLVVWERKLAQFASTEHATMFFDIPEHNQATTVDFTRSYGVDGMKAMAIATLRNWKQIAGVQAFSRVGVPSRRSYFVGLLNWMETLSDEQFRSMAAGKMWLSQLDDQSCEVIRGFAGYDPDLTLLLLDNSNITKVAVNITPRFTFTDPRSGQRVTAQVNPRTRPNGLYDPSVTKPPKPAKARQVVALDEPDKGKLNFGSGSVLPSDEIASRAGEAFGVKYDVDGRVAKNPYFICGGYTQKAFAAALEGRSKTLVFVT